MNKIKQITQSMMSANLPSDYWISSNERFSELELCHFVLQRNGQSVWEHTMSVIDLLIIKNPITLLAGLFHDLGKAVIQSTENGSLSRFHGHEEESMRIVEAILPQWGATAYMTDRVARLVSTHMFDISNITKEKTIRKFVANVAIDNIENWFALRTADAHAYTLYKQHGSILIESFRQKVRLYMSSQPVLGVPRIKGVDGG